MNFPDPEAPERGAADPPATSRPSGAELSSLRALGPRVPEHPRLDAPSPAQPGASMLPSRALRSAGASAGPCVGAQAGGEPGADAAPSHPREPRRSSPGTRRGRGAGADPASPGPGPQLGAAPEPGGTRRAPAPRPGAGLQEPVKALSSSSGRSQHVWRSQFYPSGIGDQRSCLKLQALFNSHRDQSTQSRRIFPNQQTTCKRACHTQRPAPPALTPSPSSPCSPLQTPWHGPRGSSCAPSTSEPASRARAPGPPCFPPLTRWLSSSSSSLPRCLSLPFPPGPPEPDPSPPASLQQPRGPAPAACDGAAGADADVVYAGQAELRLLVLWEGCWPCFPARAPRGTPAFPLPVRGGGPFPPAGHQEPPSDSGMEPGEAAVPQPLHRRAGPLGSPGTEHPEPAASARDLGAGTHPPASP